MGKLLYRECESCSDWNGNICHCVEICSYPMDALEEFNKYRQIGTVAECEEAREKQIAKTPYYDGDGYSDGKLIYDTWICSNCGQDYEVGYHDYEYCPNCGQRIKHEGWESD